MDNLTGKVGMSGKIIEIVGTNPSIQIPTDPNIDINTIIGDDYDPMFAIVEVIRAGTSENNRRYGNPVVRQIYTMINGVQGYLGHKDPQKSHFEFREPQSIYVGSKIEEIGGGMTRVLGKAYIFKTSKLREWIPKSIAAKNPLTVSIYGDGDVIQGSDGILEVLKMTTLESIDWANPGTQGMSTSQAVGVVSELKGDSNMDQQNPEGGAKKMERNEIVKSVTVAEVKAFNTDLVNTVIAGTTVAELKASNIAVYNEIVEEATITEMKLTVEGTEKSVKIAEIQNLLDTKEAKIAEMIENEAKAKLETFKSEKIAELVDAKYREKIAPRVTGSTEDEITASIKAEATFIAEMIGAANIENVVTGNAQDASHESLVADVKSLFGNRSKQA